MRGYRLTRLLELASLAMFFPVALAQAEGAGSHGAQFLRMQAGARASGVAGAYSALADDSLAVFWNPANLTNVKKGDLAFTHAMLPGDMSANWVSLARPGTNSALGFGVQYVSYGTIHGIDENNTDMGEFSPVDMAISVAYARNLSSNLSVGGTVKYIHSKITETATAVALDFGASHRLGSKTTLTATAQNLGKGVEYISESDSLPLVVSLGVSHSVFEDLYVLGQYSEPFDYSAYLSLGMEYQLQLEGKSSVAIRTGWSNISKDISGAPGFSFGAGISHSPYHIDYSFTPLADLGAINKISLGVSF